MPNRIPPHRPACLRLAAVASRRSPDRLAANRFYASTSWINLRRAYLAEQPLCEGCRAAGRVEAAIDVHHVKERRDHPELALVWSNLQALCKRCHNGKRRKS